jgi:dTDP-4-amino-4,6-dideoxygalactose transaminase
MTPRVGGDDGGAASAPGLRTGVGVPPGAAPTQPGRLSIPLSVPHLTGDELPALRRAVEANWIAPVGPEVDAFEEEFAHTVGGGHALATTSGTAALHLALRVLGVEAGDEVLVSTLTFCASVNPALYLGATPVFVDAEHRSWNLDPALLAGELDRRGREGRLPAAVVVVHLFGQMAEMDPILERCRRWGVPVVEDAAEALGARLGREDGEGPWAGTVGDVGIFSFDGSKLLTTSMGGMLVSPRKELVDHARKLARQAREPVPHYEHEEMGYNYRMSNLLAAFGRAQLPALHSRVAQRRAVFQGYQAALEGLPGIRFQPQAPWGVHARWLTAIQVDPERSGTTAERLRERLLAQGVESRPVWKPMHRQPICRRLGFPVLGGAVADELFERGLCLPSSSSLSPEEVEWISGIIRRGVEGD